MRNESGCAREFLFACQAFQVLRLLVLNQYLLIIEDAITVPAKRLHGLLLFVPHLALLAR